ncbi:MAG TPA: FAD-dependent oxidoreductase, partial [Burkholderiaceae bacterium]
RGLGARPTLPLRGVRGELLWLHAPGVELRRPVRCIHPRHRVYLVPRHGDMVIVGATEIDSEDRSPVSVRSALELLSTAHSIVPQLAEARIVRLDSHLRPATADQRPHLHCEPGLVRLNGLFRHGFLLAPALVEEALAHSGLGVRASAARQETSDA